MNGAERISLPLLTLQFRRQAQARAMYGRRFGVAALLLVLLLFFPIFRGLMTMVAGGGTDAEAFGRYLVTITQYLLFGAALIGPLVLAPGLLAREYEDRTLGLLLLANARPMVLVLGKFLVAFLEVELLLMLTLPVLALGAMFGGVVVADAVRLFLMLSLAAAMFTAVGTFCSARSRTRNTALILTAVTFFLLFVALGVLDWISAEIALYGTWNPYLAAISVWGWGGANAQAWPAVLLALVISPIALWAAVRALPTNVDPSSAAVSGQGRMGWVERLPWLRNPVSRVTAAYAGGLSLSGRPLYVRIGALLGLIMISLVPGVGWLVTTIVLYVAVVQTMGRMRESGALDDLLITSLDNRQLGWAFLLGLLHAAWMYFVANVVMSVAGYFIQPDIYMTGITVPALIVTGILTLANSVLGYAMLVVLAAYYGVYESRRRFNGIYVYFGIMILVGIIGGVCAIIFFSITGFNPANVTADLMWIWAPSFANAAIVLFVIVRYLRSLGRQLRYPRPTNFEDPYGRYRDEIGA